MSNYDNRSIHAVIGFLMSLFISLCLIVSSISASVYISSKKNNGITNTFINSELCTSAADIINTIYNKSEFVSEYGIKSDIYTSDDAYNFLVECINTAGGNHTSLNISPIIAPLKENINAFFESYLSDYMYAYISKCLSNEITDYNTELKNDFENIILSGFGIKLPNIMASLLKDYDIKIVYEYPENYNPSETETPVISIEDTINDIYPSVLSRLSAEAGSALESRLIVRLRPILGTSLSSISSNNVSVDTINSEYEKVLVIVFAVPLAITVIFSLFMLAMYSEKRRVIKNLGIAAVPSALLCIGIFYVLQNISVYVKGGYNLNDDVLINSKLNDLLLSFIQNFANFYKTSFMYIGAGLAVFAITAFIVNAAAKISFRRNYNKGRIIHYTGSNSDNTNNINSNSMYNSTFMTGKYNSEENAFTEKEAEDMLYKEHSSISDLDKIEQASQSMMQSTISPAITINQADSQINNQVNNQTDNYNNILNNGYRNNNSYGNNSNYSENNTYAENTSFANNHSYTNNDNYVGNKNYNENEGYTDNRSYEENSNYIENDAYEQSNSYAGNDIYEQSNNYSGNDTYEQNSNYAGNNSYEENDSYNLMDSPSYSSENSNYNNSNYNEAYTNQYNSYDNNYNSQYGKPYNNTNISYEPLYEEPYNGNQHNTVENDEYNNNVFVNNQYNNEYSSVEDSQYNLVYNNADDSEYTNAYNNSIKAQYNNNYNASNENDYDNTSNISYNETENEYDNTYNIAPDSQYNDENFQYNANYNNFENNTYDEELQNSEFNNSEYNNPAYNNLGYDNPDNEPYENQYSDSQYINNQYDNNSYRDNLYNDNSYEDNSYDNSYEDNSYMDNQYGNSYNTPQYNDALYNEEAPYNDQYNLQYTEQYNTQYSNYPNNEQYGNPQEPYDN